MTGELVDDEKKRRGNNVGGGRGGGDRLGGADAVSFFFRCRSVVLFVLLDGIMHLSI